MRSPKKYGQMGRNWGQLSGFPLLQVLGLYKHGLAWVTREQIEDGMLMDVDIGFRSVANSISPTAGAPKRLTRPLPHHRCFVAAMGNGASAATAMAASVPWLKSHLGLAETLEPMEKMVRSFFFLAK